MSGRRLLMLLPAIALIAGCGGSSDQATTATATPAAKAGSTREIRGPWAGKLTQAGLAPFRIAVVINSDGSGLVGYTGIECGGNWRLTGGSDSERRYLFTEVINRGAGGACKGTGTVHLSNTASGTLSYRFEGGGVTSSGSLMPSSLRALIPTFRQTGLNVSRATFADTIPK